MGRWLVFPLFWAAGTQAASAAPWQSTGPFTISPATDRCVANASFERGLVVALEDNPTTLGYVIRVYAPGDLRGEKWVQGKFSLGSARPKADWVVARPSSRAGTIIYTMDLAAADLTAAGPRPELKIQRMLSPGTILLDGLGDALPLLDACSADLLERWGYSKDIQRKIAAYPEPKKSWASYASPYDYPASALSALAEGETHALIDVSPEGRASNCRVIRTSGNQEIDEATCMIVTKRARYDPARNYEGGAIAAPFYLTFRWEIPKW